MFDIVPSNGSEPIRIVKTFRAELVWFIAGFILDKLNVKLMLLILDSIGVLV